MSLEAPPTPKIANGKRKNNDEYCLQKSLKRMKVTSASPGELRLQRDFKHAVCCAGWVPVGTCYNAWKVPPSSNETWYTVKQCIEDPLHLVVRSSEWTVWLRIPRLYPHHPPVLSRIEGSHPLDAVFQAGPEDPQAEIARKRGAVIVRGWSPLMRLHEILSQLIVPLLESPEEQSISSSTPPLRHCYAEADCATESREHSQCSMLQDDQMDDQIMLFPPNRFDLGYRREPGESREDSIVMTMHE